MTDALEYASLGIGTLLILLPIWGITAALTVYVVQIFF